MHYLVTYLVYIAVLARAIGWNQESSSIQVEIWILLAAFGIFLFSQEALSRRFSNYPRIYIVIQSLLVIVMLYRDPSIDFLTMLFLPLSFQVVQFFPGRVGFTWIGVFILAMAGRLLIGLEWQAGLTNVLAGGGANALMGSFAHLISRTEQRQQENQRLFTDLQEAYRQLKDSSAQTEALAAATERHHLVRELHDSLTQTLFSMNLAVQTAQLAMEEDPKNAEEYLIRLQLLAHNAAAEVLTLTGQAPSHFPTQAGLAAAIQQLVDERSTQDGLVVSFQVVGQRSLPISAETNLYRIVQEALNNIIRHAGVRQAQVRLCLEYPLANLEIVDAGCGFNLADPEQSSGFGLVGMAERAKEIDWKLEINSYPGQGTKIRVEERPS